MKHRDRFNAGQLIGTKSLGVRWGKKSHDSRQERGTGSIDVHVCTPQDTQQKQFLTLPVFVNKEAAQRSIYL